MSVVGMLIMFVFVAAGKVLQAPDQVGCKAFGVVGLRGFPVRIIRRLLAVGIWVWGRGALLAALLEVVRAWDRAAELAVLLEVVRA